MTLVQDGVFEETTEGSEISSGNLVIGNCYKITARDDADFTLDGSPDNNVGTIFIATGTNVTLDSGDKVNPITLDQWTEGTGVAPSASGGVLTNKASFYKNTGDLEQDISAEAGKIYHLGYTLDNEDALLLDETFDDWTGDDPDGWTVTGEVGTDPEISEVGPTEGHGGVGTGACNLYTSDGTYVDLRKIALLTIGKTYGYSIDITNSVAGSILLFFGTETISGLFSVLTHTGKVTAAGNTNFGVARTGGITDVTFDNLKIWECVVPEIGGQEGTPEYEDGSYVEDILAINTDPLKFIAETSMEFTIDDVEVFSEVTIYVDKDATGANDGTSWLNAFITIQAGINDAAGGDHVVCAPGTYTGAGNQNLDYGPVPNNFRVSSLFPLQAIIDCENTAATRGIAFENAETTDSIFEGFQVINGVGPASIGGGIYVNGTSPTIKNSWIRNNFAALLGGGVYVAGVGADPTLENCLITENEATVWAGGIGVNSVATGITLKNVTVINNTAGVDFAGVDIQIVTGITNTIIYGNNGTVTNENQIVGTPTYSIWDWANTTEDITSGAGVLDAGSVNPNLNTKYQPRNPLVNKGGTDSIYSDLVRDIYGIQLTDISGNWLRGFGPMGAALNLPGATISPVITNVITDVITDAVLGSN